MASNAPSNSKKIVVLDTSANKSPSKRAAKVVASSEEEPIAASVPLVAATKKKKTRAKASTATMTTKKAEDGPRLRQGRKPDPRHARSITEDDAGTFGAAPPAQLAAQLAAQLGLAALDRGMAPVALAL